MFTPILVLTANMRVSAERVKNQNRIAPGGIELAPGLIRERIFRQAGPAAQLERMILKMKKLRRLN